MNLLLFRPAYAEAGGQQEQQTNLIEDDLLLCIVRLGGSVLNGTLVTYATPKGIFLPLGEISRNLELGITVDPAAGRASGYRASASQPFQLDMRNSSLTVSGKSYTYNQGLVVIMPDDIYVESKLLGEWLAMRIDANRFDAAVDLRPFELLPIQQRMARNERGSNTWGYGSYNDLGYPLRATPYKLFGGPSIDLSLSTSLSGAPDKNISIGNGLSYFTRLSGDILLMSGQLDLSGQIAKPGQLVPCVENGHLLLQRENPSGGMLGLLDVKTIQIGDIGQSSLPLIGSTIGPGILISTYPLTQSSLFDKLTLRGFLAKGWDVELYSNGKVLDYRPSNPQENYAFVDIPLVYGLNELKLVFYGPQGERRIETHISNVGRNMIEPGSWNYQVTATDASRASLQSPATTLFAPFMTWKSTFGLSKWLTASNYLASAIIGNERQTFVGTGFSSYLKMMQVDLQVDQNLATKQWARQAGISTSIDPLTISFLLQDYDSGWQTTTGSVAFLRKWDTRLDGFHPIPFFTNSRLSMEFVQTEYSELRTSKVVQLTSLNQTRGINHTHTLVFSRMMDGSVASDSLTGISYFSLMRQNISLRAQLGYELSPQKVISTLGISSDLHLPHEWMLVGGMTYALQSNAITVSTALNRTSGAVALGVTGNYTPGGAWNAGLQLSTNLSRETKSGQWKTDGSINSQQAGVSAQVYLDVNRNGKWDPDETALQNVGFFVNQQNNRTLTDATGLAFLQGLAPNVPTDISISPSTLKELLWVPADKGLRVVPRPGYPVPVQFPVWVTGEISGTVYRKINNLQNPASGITIEAIDNMGKVVARVRSEYDGVYTLAALPTGAYIVRASPEQAAKLGTTKPFKEVSIPPEGAYIDTLDLVLEEPSVEFKGTKGGEAHD